MPMVENIRRKKARALSSIVKSDLFSNLMSQEKEFVIKWSQIVVLKKGRTLFSPGDAAQRLYLLREGLIRIFKPLEGGGDEEIAYFAPGDMIGDFDFARGAEYDAQAQALEDSVLVMFPGFGMTMDSFALEMPHIVSRLLLNSAAMITGRIKSTRELTMKNMSWVQGLQRKAYEDPGTGLWKQTFLADEIARLLEDPMALIMLKPDKFKILVDSLGHGAGDEAMIKIAAVLKEIIRAVGRGWALRFKSNETGLLINNCDAALAQSLAQSLSEAIAALPPVSLKRAREQAAGQAVEQSGEGGDFFFSGSIAWGIWPADNEHWDSLFDGTYSLLMDTWKAGGNAIVRYQGEPFL